MSFVNLSWRFLARGGQERALQNAAAACVALAERARERREVEEWLAMQMGQALPAPAAQSWSST